MNLIVAIIAITIGGFIGAGYSKSKTWADKFRFTLFLFYIATSATFIYCIKLLWDIKETLTWTIYPIFLLISLSTYPSLILVAICFLAWKKGSFADLLFWRILKK